ncbi:ankyrin repeat domain-containing protein [Niveibacterium sp. SC-1]|uniref:ankyrin repeat domain-containing protein n=1 Tax=Niveibacterium sp. SC-1 TaxID=3135646 RepID=UPI00311DD84A
MSQDFYAAASRGECAEIHRMLACDGSLVYGRDEQGATALHRAAQEGSVKAVVLLLDAGSDPNTQDREGLGALHVCASAGAARALIANGAKLELRSCCGQTPLVTQASAKGRREGVVEVLLKAGADVGSRDAHGNTALTVALGHERHALSALLRRYGAMDSWSGPEATAAARRVRWPDPV